MNPLADLLLSTARRNPDRPLLRTPAGEIWAHGDLDRRSAALAHVLVSRGVQPSDRVVVQLGKSADVVALHVAVVRVGAVYVPLNMAYTDTELSGLLEDADPALVVRDARPAGSFAHASLEDLLQEGSWRPGHFTDVARTDRDPAAMLYTSGTTGRPKGAIMSQGNLVSSTTTLASAWGFTEEDVLLHMLPLYHTHGLFVAVYCALTSGGSMVLLDEFSPDAVIRELPGCTVMMGVPTHYTRLLARPDFTADVTGGVRLFTSGSAPMLTTTHEQFEQRTGQVILERYGMTETCMLTSNPLTGVRKPGTVGLPLPGVDVRLTDGAPGGIEVRGPNVFSGYWRRPELMDTEFTRDGWFRTGDLGRFDDDGYLEIVGRSKDLVITGGLNVYPKEVEYVLDSLPGVLESAVVGLPDADFGESVTAAVIAEPGVELDPEGLRLLAREQLAAFKVPKRIVLLEHLPRNAMGKVEKARLRDVLPTMIVG